MEVNAESGKPPVGTPPTVLDEGEDGKPEMISKAEAKEIAERKIKAVARENKALADRLAKFEAEADARKQSEMSKDELLAKERTEREALAKRLKDREDADAAELAEVEEENKEAIKSLKKDRPDLSDLIPDGLGVKALAKWLSKVRSKTSIATIGVHGGGGRGAAAKTPDEEIDTATANLHARMRGERVGGK